MSTLTEMEIKIAIEVMELRKLGVRWCTLKARHKLTQERMEYLVAIYRSDHTTGDGAQS